MTILEQQQAQVKREQIQREINMHKVEKVDHSVYHKSEQDKAKLFKLKNEWKIKVANGHIVNTFIHSGAHTAPIL